MEGLFQPFHLLIILAVILLFFGPKKIPEIGKGLGEGIRGFKEALKSVADAAEASKPEAQKTETAKSEAPKSETGKSDSSGSDQAR